MRAGTASPRAASRSSARITRWAKACGPTPTWWPTTCWCGFEWCCLAWHRLAPGSRFRQGRGTMHLRLIIAAVSCVLAAPAFGEETYRIDPLHTATTFAVSHLGVSMQRGSFGRTTGTVMLDRAAGKGTIDVSIDASTVNSGSPSRETLLKGEDYFNVAQYPTITFKATKLRFEGNSIVAC